MRLPGVLLWCGLLLAAQPEGKARLNDLQIDLQGRRLAVGFRLVNAFDEELIERLKTGLPTGFTYRFKLTRDRKRWFDEQVDASQLEVVARYDAVTREYQVNYRQDGKLIESRVVRDMAELEEAMTRFKPLPVFTITGHPPDRRLQVKVRAELGVGTFLYLIPTRSETDWAESRKFRPPMPGGGLVTVP